ncbi:MAG TPA: hypothetical protein VF550_21950 [Polyangia bacterium]
MSGVVDGGTIPDGGGNRCGGLNDPCCSNIRCTAGNVVCHTNDTCVSCGKLGERCCSTSVCTTAGTVCAAGGGAGGADTCRTCGGDGQPCCSGRTCTTSGLTCNRTNSATCG